MRQARTSSTGAYAEVSARDETVPLPLDPPVVDDPSCPVRLVLDRIADKWTAQTITVLAEGPHRFGQLRRAIPGISEKMLSSTLRGLEHDGLLDRTVETGPPLKVTYELTPFGHTLVPPLAGLVAWAKTHGPRLLSPRLATPSLGSAPERNGVSHP